MIRLLVSLLCSLQVDPPFIRLLVSQLNVKGRPPTSSKIRECKLDEIVDNPFLTLPLLEYNLNLR